MTQVCDFRRELGIELLLKPLALREGISKLGRSAGPGFAIRILGMALLFAQTWVLIRLLGSVKFGDYAWALAWVTILRLIVSLGFDQLVVRETAVYLARKDWASMKGFLHRCDIAVLSASIVILPIAAVAGTALAKTGSGQAKALWPALLWLPFIGWLTIRSAAIQGLGRFGLSRLGEDVVFPGLFLGFLATAGYRGMVFSAAGAMIARAVCLAVAVLAANVILRSSLPKEALAIIRRAPVRAWMTTTVPLILIGTANVVLAETGTILIGVLRGSAESGIYAIALRIAFLLTLSEFAVQGVLGPRLARMHERGDKQGLQRLITLSARTVTGLASILGLLYLLVPGMFLRLFGSGFVSASAELRVLTIGWLINLSFGSSGLLLIMIGEERKAAAGLVIGALINVPLAVLLVHKLGGLGAAISTATAMLIWNSILWWQAWKLGYETSLIGLVTKYKEIGAQPV